MIDQLLAADRSLFLWINALPHPGWLTALMAGATVAGMAGACWTVGGVVVAVHRRDAGGLWRLVLAMALAFVLVEVIVKPVVTRPRPYETHAVTIAVPSLRPTTSSFPSGHAASAAAGAFALSRVLPTAWPALWSLVLVIAASRVYLGMHYPLDVGAGLLLGLACAVFVTGGKIYPGVRGQGAGKRI